MNYKIPFSGRSILYRENEIKAVVDAMQQAIPLTQGRHRGLFEEAFAGYTGSPHVFAVNNATSALELSAQLCQFEAGDEVIIPAHTFTSSAYPFLKNGARIVWADIDLETRVVNAEAVANRITSKTKAIVVVHLYGYGADMPEIMTLASEHNLMVIEDAAQALGVKIAGKMAGTYGDFGVFSFHSHKNITTLGEGGMFCTNNSEIAALVPMLRHNGHCGFEAPRENYWSPAMGNVDFPELHGKFLWPHNFCIGEVECALGVELLKRNDELNSEKRRRALRFIDALGDFPNLEFHRVDNDRHNYHLLAGRFLDRNRDRFMHMMSEEESIQCVVQYCPLNRYPLYQKAGFGNADCHGCDTFFDNMVSFPFEHMISEGDFNTLIDASIRVLKKIYR
jgi:perosamine synthetase